MGGALHFTRDRRSPAGGDPGRQRLENPIVSIKVDDVDAAYEDAQRRGYEIVHPLSVEEWGVRRFFLRAPDGNVLNIVQHHR